MKRMLATLAAVGVVAVGAVAQARIRWISFSPEQIGITTGTGIADFAGSTMRGNARLGAGWDARVLFGTRTPIGFEAGYSGVYNTLSTDRFTFGTLSAPYMVQNSVDATLRINLLPWQVQPYIFGGIGYNHASVFNRDQDPAMGAKFRASDNQGVAPVGGGVAGYFGQHITADARFTYRTIFGQDIFIPNPDARLDTYVVAARLGYTF
jgi:hypothetical protein